MYHNRTKLDNKTYLLFIWTHFYKKELGSILFIWSIFVFIALFLHLDQMALVRIEVIIFTLVYGLIIFIKKYLSYIRFKKQDPRVMDYVFEKDTLHIFIQVRNQTFEQVMPYFIIKQMITTKEIVLLYTSRNNALVLKKDGFEEPFYLIKAFIQAELLLNDLK